MKQTLALAYSRFEFSQLYKELNRCLVAYQEMLFEKPKPEYDISLCLGSISDLRAAIKNKMEAGSNHIYLGEC